MFLSQYLLSQHAGYNSFAYSFFFFFWFNHSKYSYHSLQNRLMKADMDNLLFVKRKVCAWIFFFFFFQSWLIIYLGGKFVGGTTYIAIASLALASSVICESQRLSPAQRELTIQWLLRNQDHSGGFRGRTGKEADACYCFWCCGALKVSHTSISKVERRVWINKTISPS